MLTRPLGRYIEEVKEFLLVPLECLHLLSDLLHPLTKCVTLKIFVESSKANVLAMVSSVKLFDTTREGVAEDCATAHTGESSIMTVSIV